MRKRKYTIKEKLQIVTEAIEEQESAISLGKKYNICDDTLSEWIRNYQTFGPEIFCKNRWEKRTASEKENAVLAYLSGEGSMREICARFKISSTYTLRHWILKYNSHERLKDSAIGGTLTMTKGRTTTLEERIKIVEYCISHDRNYSKTAEKYRISYGQARNYVMKYDKGGIEALRDNRGKRKKPEAMNEIERLRAENRILKAEKARAEMELAFLKKLEEIERRRG